MHTTRVLLADGHRSFVDALAMSVDAEDALQVVGAVVDPGEALRVVSTRPVDVAVIAVDGAGNSFLDVGLELVAVRPALKLVGIADTDDLAILARAVRQGFRGWVPKDVGIDALLDVIYGVGRGETCIPPLLLTPLLDCLLKEQEEQRVAERPFALLTLREQQVLKAMSRGATRHQIAAELAISANTVRSHTQSILNKLDVHTSLAAVTLARRAGVS